LVEAAGLTDVLAGEGPYTVFAPTNEAFAEVPQAALDYLAANPEVLTRVLTYHVVSGAVMAADITDMMAPSMEMSAVGADMTGSELDVKVTDAGVTVNGANVVAADVVAISRTEQRVREIAPPLSGADQSASDGSRRSLLASLVQG
jgi:uncharacterized surface protein with fasciclin (FAS1) repeats